MSSHTPVSFERVWQAAADRGMAKRRAESGLPPAPTIRKERSTLWPELAKAMGDGWHSIETIAMRVGLNTTQVTNAICRTRRHRAKVERRSRPGAGYEWRVK